MNPIQYLFGGEAVAYYKSKDELIADREEKSAHANLLYDQNSRKDDSGLLAYEEYLENLNCIDEHYNTEVDNLIDTQLPRNGTFARRILRIFEKTF